MEGASFQEVIRHFMKEDIFIIGVHQKTGLCCLLLFVQATADGPAAVPLRKKRLFEFFYIRLAKLFIDAGNIGVFSFGSANWSKDARKFP